MSFDFEMRVEYGNLRYFPLSEDAKLLLELMNRKVLHHAEIKLMRMGGWDVEVNEPLEERN